MTSPHPSARLAAIACVSTCLLALPTPAHAEGNREGFHVDDVALAEGGLFLGQLFDAGGQPLAGEQISLQLGDQRVASTHTDAHGRFAVKGLRGGMYQVDVAGSPQLCRLWAHGTAPPRATEQMLYVREGDVTRAQWCPPPGVTQFFRHSKVLMANPYVVGGVLATAVGVPVLVHNLDDDPQS